MDLANIVCVCQQKFKKNDFKIHYKKCKIFKTKFYDFDLRIGMLLQHYLLVKENSSIIKFLFQRYIKLIDHKFKTKEINIINAISKNKKKEKKEEVQFNSGQKNNDLYQKLYCNDNDKDNDNDNELDKEFLKRLSFKGDAQNINKYNLYQQNNNIIRFEKVDSSMRQYQTNYNNNMIRSTPIQYINNNNIVNMQNQQNNNFGQDINKSLSFNMQNYNANIWNKMERQGYNCNNGIYSLTPKNNNNYGGSLKAPKIGPNLKQDEKTYIINFCNDEFKKYEGKCNQKMIQTISKYIKSIYPDNKWFILICNNEYSDDVYYNLAETIPGRFMMFNLGKLHFQLKEYK